MEEQKHIYVPLSDTDTKAFADAKGKDHFVMIGIDKKAGKMDISVYSNEGEKTENIILNNMMLMFQSDIKYKESKEEKQKAKQPVKFLKTIKHIFILIQATWIIIRINRKLRKILKLANLETVKKNYKQPA